MQFLVTLGENAEQKFNQRKIGAEALAAIQQELPQMKEILLALEMEHALAQFNRAQGSIRIGTDWAVAAALFGSLRTACRTEFGKMFAGYIKAERAKHWGRERPFGDVVYDQFESARKDATSAGNCFAVGEWDACVFHSMRVAERGLRSLAYERGIRKVRNSPVEWADWQNLIDALSAKADEIRGWKGRGPAKDRALDFYRGAVGEMLAFKDSFRNYVMHARPDADNDLGTATTAYNRVGEFMARIAAAGLSDTLRGAIPWRKR